VTCNCPPNSCGECCTGSETCDGGEYPCYDIFSSGSQDSGASAAPVGTIAGAALGGFIAIALIAFVILWVVRRRSRSASKDFAPDRMLKVYTVENPSYGHMSPEDMVTPNYLRCVAFNMWRGQRLMTLSDLNMLETHDMLRLQRPPSGVTVTLRQHANEFLDTVVPIAPIVASDALIDDVVNFMFEAFPDLLTEIAIDAVATSAQDSSDEALYERFYACLQEAVGYEEVGDSDPLYDDSLEPDFIQGNDSYMETDEIAYHSATSKPESNYALAAATPSKDESPYALAAATPGHEVLYSFAGGSTGEATDDEPWYHQEPPEGIDEDEPTYTLAAAGTDGAEPTYARASGSGDAAEPTYALGAAESADYANADDPVYDLSEDAP